MDLVYNNRGDIMATKTTTTAKKTTGTATKNPAAKKATTTKKVVAAVGAKTPSTTAKKVTPVTKTVDKTKEKSMKQFEKAIDKLKTTTKQPIVGTGPRGMITIEDILGTEKVKTSKLRIVPKLSYDSTFEKAIRYEVENRETTNGLYHHKVKDAIKFIKTAKFTFGFKPFAKAKEVHISFVYIHNTAKAYQEHALLKLSAGDQSFKAQYKYWTEVETLVKNSWDLFYSKAEKTFKEEALKILLVKLDSVYKRL